MVDAVLLNKISQQLEQHEQSMRAKKLIFCVCKKYWENDNSVLGTFAFKHLLEEIVELHNNRQQLRYSIFQVVSLLNRKDLYTSISNLIVNIVSPFYQQSEQSEEVTGFIIPPVIPEETKYNDTFSKVVERLQNDRNSLRIKKIILYVCRQKWVNDPLILNSFDFNELIKDLKDKYNSLSKLENGLFEVVNTLNRKDVYSLVAKTIINEIEVLYNTQTTQSNTITNSQNSKIKRRPASQETVIDSDFTLDYGTPTVRKKTKRIVPESFSKTYIVENPEEIQQQIIQAVKEDANYDVFTVRQELMKYGNPLRAKILLFSLLHHTFNNSSNDWALLNTCILDDLMYKAYTEFRDLKVLEEKLSKIANLMKDNDEYIQSVNAIIEALQSF